MSYGPVDMPTAYPYLSQNGSDFYAFGKQSACMYTGYCMKTEVGPMTPYLAADNYTTALQQCTDLCDQRGCLSINIFTSHPIEYAWAPWVCCIMDRLYDPQTYTDTYCDNSFAWSRQPPQVNMPSADPYISQEGKSYYALGSQNGMTLPGTYKNHTGEGTYPTSNDYTAAITQCTAICDSDPECELFNLFTVAELDFNSGIPTWACRFSNSVYNPADFTDDNSPRPSYVWARQAPTNPVNMPTNNPYISYADKSFYPIGSQGGMTLESSYNGQSMDDAQPFPTSNDYSLALSECTAICDFDPTCVFINVFTVTEADFNSGLPSWRCFFGGQTYNPDDFTKDIGNPSYVWARQPYVPPPTSANVLNNCTFDVFLWSVGGNVSDSRTLHQGGRYQEIMTVDPNSKGRSIKIAKENSLNNNPDQTVLSYDISTGKLFYGLNDVYGDPFAGFKVIEAPSDASCPSMVWENGTPQQPNIADCQSEASITLTLCA